MDAETLTLQKEVVFNQTSKQVMASSDDDAKVPFVEPVCKTMVIEQGSVGNGQHHDEVKEENSGPARLYLNPSNSLVYMKNGPAIGIAMSPTEEVREVYLKNMFMMPPNHGFYCPNCHIDINKVLFCTTRQQDEFEIKSPGMLLKGPPILPTVTQPPVTTEPTVTTPTLIEPEQDNECLVRCSTCFSLLIQKGKEFFTGLVSRAPQELESGQGDQHVVPIPDSSPIMPQGPPFTITRPESTKGWEILKSIVYGGLAELLASLSVVTSAASVDATTLSIVALGVANLIGGLSVLGHNLRDLKASQPRQGSETQAQEDKYYELLGKRENFYLHAFFAILSFLIFGLVPPIAYGFSFRESNDKDLKLAAVAVASLICITLLGMAKAHIQRSNTFMTYFKTVTFYVTSGVLASLLTYEAGALMKKLVEQLGWFETKSNFGLTLPEMMSIKKSGWGSY